MRLRHYYKDINTCHMNSQQSITNNKNLANVILSMMRAFTIDIFVEYISNQNF